MINSANALSGHYQHEKNILGELEPFHEGKLLLDSCQECSRTYTQ